MRKRQGKGVNKGASSGLLISILVHVGAFTLAGALVVFTVVNKEEKQFEPPKPVERPKMKLKKPKVKVKKNSKPKSTNRIVTKVQKANMPDIQLPEMSGMGDGLGAGGLGGFDIAVDFTETTVFGSGQTTGSDLVGTFYDFKRRRSGATYSCSREEFQDRVGKFVKSGFRPSKLANVYRSPRKLYATSFMVPTVKSSAAPKAFGEETGGWTWMCHYTGDLVHKDGIKFRFWGQGDDILVVGVDGEVVLNASWPNTETYYSPWISSDSKSRTYRMGNNLSVPGDWITLEPGVPVKLDVVLGESPGGHFDAMLVVEVEGEEYERNAQQGPILPMFKTAEPSFDLLDAIYEWLIPGEACLTNGPVFSDFGGGGKKGRISSKKVIESMPEPELDPMRVWTMNSGKTVEAEFISTMGDKIVLKTAKGKQVKVPRVDFTEADIEYIQLENPPKLNIDFRKLSNQHTIQTTPYLTEIPPRQFTWTFGAKLKQMSAGNYPHELDVEYFAIGHQYLDQDKYILLDRNSTKFTLTKENGREFSFLGEEDAVETINYDMKEQARGEKVKGYLILVRDKRGKIIQYRTSNEWLYENRANLAKLPVGAYFEKDCIRTHPTSPKRWY